MSNAVRVLLADEVNRSPHPEIPAGYWQRWLRGDRAILVQQNAVPLALIVGNAFDPADFPTIARIAPSLAWNQKTEWNLDWNHWDAVPLTRLNLVRWWAIAPRFAESILCTTNR